ncbi:hypothetical protein [Amycolatopsis mediterranei]|uniref:hypothetical protein n=1 Tax=Amycolatopsis mediterranei TaxID=33910 RepID=UPI00049FF955|nr:hypothetical protein [Amycolatopsis mediterranei]KDO04797.1 hypothetical protein DV26_42090 [Amycolatopsis mediterranei]KDU85828.1 hypothetical protein DV36_44060 [Amycolatopsis mediterranei]UZF72253.1 hypothetical protein ISP_005582 [Amycolatopsis mediterranei]
MAVLLVDELPDPVEADLEDPASLSGCADPRPVADEPVARPWVHGVPPQMSTVDFSGVVGVPGRHEARCAAIPIKEAFPGFAQATSFQT